MKITVVVPTYRRPQDLERCLKSLQRQTRLPDEIVVVVRHSDIETQTFLKIFQSNNLPVRIATVEVPGVVAAMNVGLAIAQGDIISFTDDDAAPRLDWLAQIEAHMLSDERIAGVGGRDWVHHGTQVEEGARKVVGQVQWFGRITGEHHLGVGKAREVDVLKGVNMSFRRSAIRERYFDSRMQGTGAQVHYEVAFCLSLKRAGWKLIYDPLVAVDHYPAQRFDEDQRNKFNNVAITNAAHNETLSLLEYLLPMQRIVFLIWAVLVGTRENFGFIQWLRFLSNEGTLAGWKWMASLRGRWQGWLTWQKRRGSTLSPIALTDK